MSPIALILSVLGAYLALGVLFAIPFLARGLSRIDPAARGSSPLFRVLIAPGVAALWPVLALKWRRARDEGASA